VRGERGQRPARGAALLVQLHGVRKLQVGQPAERRPAGAQAHARVRLRKPHAQPLQACDAIQPHHVSQGRCGANTLPSV